MQRIEEGLSLEAALPLFDLHGTDAVEVFDTQGQVIGVLTRTDLEKAQCEAALGQLVGECIRYRVTGIKPPVEAKSRCVHCWMLCMTGFISPMPTVLR